MRSCVNTKLNRCGGRARGWQKGNELQSQEVLAVELWQKCSWVICIFALKRELFTLSQRENTELGGGQFTYMNSCIFVIYCTSHIFPLCQVRVAPGPPA